jgi:thiamine-phosphate pyrophosphorylase
LYEAARRLRELTRRADAALLVSDRIDVALAAEADAVHLGWTSLPVEATRRIVGTRCRIGVSTHTLQEARDAARSGADYITFSPVFPTPSKEGLVAVTGLEGLREAVAGVSIPVIALGGIQAGNAPDCLDRGAAGVACIRAVFGGQSPGEAARTLAAALARSGLE